MALVSMTGYSKVSDETEYGKITLELSSVNRKYCEVQVSTPRILSFLEADLRQRISSSIHRGRVSANISFDMGAKNSLAHLTPNTQYIDAYVAALKQIQQQYGLSGSIDISVFQGNREILAVEQENIDEEAVMSIIYPLVDQAIESLIEQKKLEGVNLQDDIVKRIALIVGEVDGIEQKVPDSVHAYREKIVQRIEELQIEISVDEDRIAREVALYADRIDISEEIVRLRSHINNFKKTLDKDEPVGKMLDFTIQEMFRETNTIAAKCNNSDISHATIRIRNELEKIREQVYNVE